MTEKLLTRFGPTSFARTLAWCGVFAGALLASGCQMPPQTMLPSQTTMDASAETTLESRLSTQFSRAGAWVGRTLGQTLDKGADVGARTVRGILPGRGLRSAPPDSALFLHAHDTGDASLNTRALETQVWIASLPASRASRAPTLTAVDRTLDNGVMVFRPGRPGPVRRVGRPYGRLRQAPGPVAPRLRAPLRPAPLPINTGTASVGTPSTAPAGEPVSYMRLDGGPLSMGDWTQCELQTGGAFLVGPTVTEVAPDFDACMRGRGYLPEAEAAARLTLR